MKLYKKKQVKERGSDPTDPTRYYTEKELPATLDDLKAALAEHGFVAVPMEPTEKAELVGLKTFQQTMLDASDSTIVDRVYKAMIRAAQENNHEKE